MATQDPRHVVTGEARLSYVHLTQPRRNNRRPTDAPKYGVTVLVPKTDARTKQLMDNGIAAAIQMGVEKKWGGQRPPQPPIPLWDGDGLRSTGEAFGPECRGHWVITASNTERPRVVDLNLQDIVDASQIYSGMYGNVSFDFFPYNSEGKRGIGCSLVSVRKTRDGEPLVSRASVEDDYGAGNAPWQQPAQPAYQQPYSPPAAPAMPPQQPQYTYPPVPPQQPYGQPAAPVQPQYGAPVYQQPAQPAYAPQGYPPAQQPVYPQQPQIDPVTGLPITGGVLGIG